MAYIAGAARPLLPRLLLPLLPSGGRGPPRLTTLTPLPRRLIQVILFTLSLYPTEVESPNHSTVPNMLKTGS